MKIKRLTKKDKEQYFELIKDIENNLENKVLFLPIYECEIKEFFDEKITYLYGIFDNGKLIASSALFLGQVKLITKHMNLKTNKVGEIGRSMTHPNYRGKGYMKEINIKILEKAKELNLDCVVATVHPDNTSSYRSLENLGFENVQTITKEEGYIRYIMYKDMKAKN